MEIAPKMQTSVGADRLRVSAAPVAGRARLAAEAPVVRTLCSSALLVANLGFKAVSQLVLVPISLKYLSVSEFSASLVVQGVGSYLGMSEVGLGQAVMNRTGAAFARRDYARLNAVLTNAFALYHLLVLAFWTALAIACLRHFWDAWLPVQRPLESGGHLSVHVLLFGTLTLLKVPWTAFPAALAGIRQMPLRQFYDLVVAILVFTATTVTLVLGGKVPVLLFVNGCSSLVLSIISYPLLRWRAPEICLQPSKLDKRLVRFLACDSVHFALISVAFIMHRWGPTLLAARYGSPADVALIFAMVTIFRVFGWSLVEVLSRAAQPYLIMLGALHEEGRIVSVARLAVKLSFGIATTFTGLVLVHADWLLDRWLAPVQFAEGRALVLLAGAFLLDAFFLPVTNVAVALQRHKRMALMLALEGTVGLMLSAGVVALGLVPVVRAVGVGFLAAASVVNLGWMRKLASRQLGLSAKYALLDWLLRCGAYAAAVGVAVVLGRLAPAGAWRMLLGSLAVVGMASVSVALVLLAGEEKACLRHWMRDVRTTGIGGLF